jgi:hypothetical protein
MHPFADAVRRSALPDRTARQQQSPTPPGHTRRARLALGSVALAVLFPAALDAKAGPPSPRIDRHALVSRHDPKLTSLDPRNPLSVGNGEFAFTVDATGLQTFPEAFTETTPLGTLSHWGWHTSPNPDGFSPERFRQTEYAVFGRKVGYNDIPDGRRTPEIEWLRANPHRLHLGQVGFALVKADGTAARPDDLTDVDQALALWDGLLRSRFRFEGEPVEVETVCHPDRDLIAVRVVSPLPSAGRLAVRIRFPYGTGSTVTADWTRPEAHRTDLLRLSGRTAEFVRTLDGDGYRAAARWSEGGRLTEAARHDFVLTPSRDAAAFELVVAFAPKRIDGTLPSFEETRTAAARHWRTFWSTGGAIDLSASADPRWRELERRIVLSQYLTAIQCAGSLPPAETGLTYNSWEGKFHLEMHWWHAAQFALWDRLPLLEKSLRYYRDILPRAREQARRQGYAGARWPKMADPRGVDSPSTIGPFLIWQQPHPIFYAELCFRTRGDRATLEQHREVVMRTAEFMASYADRDERSGRYVLGPILQCAQEIFPKDRTLNPTFELTYWRWGLETAQRWRERLGLPREPAWDRVLAGLARPALEEGKYLFAETATGTWTDGRWKNDHPSVTAALGMLPGPGIDEETMGRTLDGILAGWSWPDTWGWDTPMLAMCAARLGKPEKAVDALLLDVPKNRFGPSGHNYQRPGLSVYLPGNGGLLYAVAMMAAGWDGAPAKHAPGFPDGWTVRQEGLRVAP